MDKQLWKVGPFLLFIDLVAYAIWLIYYCVALLNDDNPMLNQYRAYHYALNGSSYCYSTFNLHCGNGLLLL